MAFWAIEKVKNLSGIISTKDVSEKIKTYMPQTNQSSDISSDPPKKQLTEQQMIQVQIAEYEKLCDLQQQILKSLMKTKQQKYRQEEKKLLKQLQKINNDIQVGISQQRKQQLVSDILTGKTTVKQIIKEKIIINQNLYKNEAPHL